MNHPVLIAIGVGLITSIIIDSIKNTVKVIDIDKILLLKIIQIIKIVIINILFICITILFNLSLLYRISLFLLFNLFFWLHYFLNSQISREIIITDSDLKNKSPLFKANKLKPPYLHSKITNDKIEMTWDTFGKGIEILTKKIKQTSGEYPDIIFGINEAGVMIASYLSYFLEGRPPIGIIKTGAKLKDKEGNTNRQIEQMDFPSHDIKQCNGKTLHKIKFKEPDCIMVIDSEVKSGKSAECIIKLLRTEYNNPELKVTYIGLCGVIENKHKEKKELPLSDFGWKIEHPNKPTYFTFCCYEKPGFEPPGGIR